jgi:hypothetical protein
MRWLEHTPEPLRKRPAAPLWRHLNYALALTTGIDSVVILKDVCGLDDEEALEVLRWTSKVILQGAVEQAPARQKSRPRSREKTPA